MPETTKPSIILLAAAETSPSVLYGLYDVLYSVGTVFPDMTLGEPGPEALDVRIAAAGAQRFRCGGDIVVEPHASIDEIGGADAVIVCDMYTPINVPPRGKRGHDRDQNYPALAALEAWAELGASYPIVADPGSDVINRC